jgi:DNA-binding CsgD family transcriptional regulator
MSGPRLLLSLGDGVDGDAMAERAGPCQAPVDPLYSRPHPSSAGKRAWPGCAGWWIRSRGRARSWSSPVRRGWQDRAAGRRRRINDATPVLTEALGTFRQLDARFWAQRAEAELRACGVTAAETPGERDAPWELTPQQRQIVRLASDGLTNREIGDRLFLSPRTVSSHLYRSYPMLGVADRHQLRDVIARASTPAPTRKRLNVASTGR